MDDFHINNDNYFRKYAPLWDINICILNAYFYSSYSFSKSILVKKDMLESIIKHIDDLMILIQNRFNFIYINVKIVIIYFCTNEIKKRPNWEYLKGIYLFLILIIYFVCCTI